MSPLLSAWQRRQEVSLGRLLARCAVLLSPAPGWDERERIFAEEYGADDEPRQPPSVTLSTTYSALNGREETEEELGADEKPPDAPPKAPAEKRRNGVARAAPARSSRLSVLDRPPRSVGPSPSMAAAEIFAACPAVPKASKRSRQTSFHFGDGRFVELTRIEFRWLLAGHTAGTGR